MRLKLAGKIYFFILRKILWGNVGDCGEKLLILQANSNNIIF
jgi:hypothetical protein